MGDEIRACKQGKSKVGKGVGEALSLAEEDDPDDDDTRQFLSRALSYDLHPGFQRVTFRGEAVEWHDTL